MRTWISVVVLALTSVVAAARTLPPVKESRVARVDIVAKEILAEDTRPTQIEHPGATFISVHFDKVKLGAGDSLTVRSDRSDGRSWTYTKENMLPSGTFWSVAIPGDGTRTRVIIELSNASGKSDYRIDRYSAGLSNDRIVAENKPPSGLLEICGNDDTQNAICYSVSDPAIYMSGRAVARLLINGQSACTGWLVGDAGHMITNEHCIGSAADARNVQVEMVAEGATCTTNCKAWFACPGTIVATRGELLKFSAAKDYALLKLSSAIPKKYGYLKLRTAGPAVKGERAYIPQHPRGEGKRIAVVSTEPEDQTGPTPGFVHANSLTEPGCGTSSNDEVGYLGDTDPGASGSPVLGFSDNAVIALHHCGGCPNRGIAINKIIPEIKAFLPKSAYK
jgi:lysyl endopeptidase